MEKCEFAQKEIKFLGHLVSENQVRMDPKKVQAIVDWQAPHSVKDLRSFSGLANYYRKYVAGYSKRAAAMTDLLKNDVKCSKYLSGLILELPFEVHSIDASDKVWRVYLLGTRVVVWTDNVVNTFFKTQKKLSPKQARWQKA
ncbi:hypothetical protein KY285_016461 [Solanum tuberosum]|nr:hypothetical protein KY284_016462 [Solanum tuberosum]KAH0702183.1 hypothetical protein KY285_016461 [Solanum tuberosum]